MELKTLDVDARAGGATLTYELSSYDKLRYMINNLCLNPPSCIEFKYAAEGNTWVDPSTKEQAPLDHRLHIMVSLISEIHD